MRIFFLLAFLSSDEAVLGFCTSHTSTQLQNQSLALWLLMRIEVLLPYVTEDMNASRKTKLTYLDLKTYLWEMLEQQKLDILQKAERSFSLFLPSLKAN